MTGGTVLSVGRMDAVCVAMDAVCVAFDPVKAGPCL